MSLHKDEAIVLFKRAYSESDRIIHLFTRGSGKISAIAKGAGKSQKRFMNTFEPFNHIRVEYFEKNGRGMVRIDNADLVNSNSGIEVNLKRVCAASFFTEFVSRLTRERQAHADLFYALKECLDIFKIKDPDYIDILHHELRMLDILGYRPNFDTCVFCSASVEDRNRIYFSRERGGILCGACSRSLPHTVCSAGLMRGFLAARHMQDDFATKALQNEAQEIMEGFIAYHIDVDFRSYKLLKSVVL